MTKREKKLIIDRYVQVKNLTEWYSYKLSKDNYDEPADREYAELRYRELDHESITLGSLGNDLGLWNAMWDAYWEQRPNRSTY